MIENFWGEHGQKWVCQSGDGTLKLTVFEEWTDGINWFYACWYRFTEIKRWSKSFWVYMDKNVRGHSGHGNLKLTVSQKYTDRTNWFFCMLVEIQES